MENKNNQKKNILILTNDDIALYSFRKELIIDLLAQGNEVYISSLFGNRIKEFEEMGCKLLITRIDRRGINPFKDFKQILYYKKIIQRIKPDLILTYTIKPNIYGGFISRRAKIPYYVTITGLGTAFQKGKILKNFVVFLYRISMKKVSNIFFENEDNLNTFINNKIISPEKAVLLSGAGVNLEEYKFSPMENNDIIRFLFMGRIMKEKGIDELFEAAKKIKAEFNNIEFDFIGGMEENYLKIIEDLKNNKIINYYGFRMDVKPYIINSHCVILPSYHEGMSNTLLESAAMGRPLITSNINGCKEAVKDNISGYLVESKNAEDLYKKIKQFINLTNEQREQMGKDSRALMEEVFDRKIVVNKVMERINSKEYC